MKTHDTATLIKELREKNNYTLQDVADAFGLSKTAVSNWETKGIYSLKTLYDISRFYGISIDELYSGELENEPIIDFCNRNYRLDNTKIDKLLKDDKIDEIIDFYDKYKALREKFYELLPKWVNDELNERDIHIFRYIKQYYELDYDYYSYINGDNNVSYLGDEKEKEFIEKLINNNKNINWELQKVYLLKYDLKLEEVFNSNNKKAMEALISSLTQIEKNELLNHGKYNSKKVILEYKNELKFMNNQSIESIRAIRLLLALGAKVIINPNDYNYCYTWDAEAFNKCDGKIEELKRINELLKENDNDSFNHNYYITSWKKYSYDEYNRLVDEKETERLNDVCFLKHRNPIKYYDKYLKEINI